MTEHEALEHAIRVASLAPCAKSKRGVVIFHRESPEVFSRGFNTPPPGFACDGSSACRVNCNKLCVHAEDMALIFNPAPFAPGCELLHVKVEMRATETRDVLVPVAVSSDGPSCWQCSRAVLRAGISRVGLLQAAPGYYPFDIAAAVLRSYTAAEFHRLTLEACELPVIMQETP